MTIRRNGSQTAVPGERRSHEERNISAFVGSLALATAIAALAAPAAWAAPAEQILSEERRQHLGSPPGAAAISPSSAPVSTASDGFDWGDAGIGATVGLALAAMVGGTALVLRTRPQRGSVA